MSRQMGLIMSQCECRRKSNDSEESSLMEQLKEQIHLNGKLQDEVSKLREKVDDQNEMIEKQFGKNIERTAKGRYNNTAEAIQPTTLSLAFQDIFDGEWRSVMKSLFRGNKEMTGIKFLSRIFEDCQSFCQAQARNQLVNFVNPFSEKSRFTVEEVIKSTEDVHNLHKLRRIVGLYEQNKDTVISMFADECEERKDFNKLTEEIKEDKEKIECLKEYIKKCCDLCWQCAISDPPVLLKFDVLCERLDDVSDFFQEYHYHGEIEEGVSNTVMQVVWPAVAIKDVDEDSEILVENAKGYVIVCPSSAV